MLLDIMKKPPQGEAAIITRLALKVSPGAKRNALGSWYGEALKVYVTAAPEKGKANEAVVELLAQALGVARTRISVVSGQTSSQKLVEIAGLDAAAIQTLIGAALLKQAR